MKVTELLNITVEKKASDLHLVASYLPTVRIEGELKPLVTFSPFTSEDIEEIVFSLINSAQKEVLLTNKELDFSTTVTMTDGRNFRFRVNAYYQKGTMAVSFRLIPSYIKTINELNLPTVLYDFAKLRQGFLLITGASGQGKSTTVASIIEEINKTRQLHIITIEDPIEYVFPKNKAIISQREMYYDTHSWPNALKNILREDPDIVFIGEMRDYETIASALTIAETGHLVLSTLHTNTAGQTIDRIIDIFPDQSRSQVRMQLSMVLSGVVTQRLVPGKLGNRLPVCEILLGSSSVKNTIREGNTHLLDNIVQTSKDSGMTLFEDSLKQLVEQNLISHEIALEYALRPDRYLHLMQR